MTFKAKRPLKTPTFVQLLLTRRCNLDCIYCSAETFHRLETTPELDTQEWIRLLIRLRDLEIFKISLSGGEIFTRADIAVILRKISELNFPSVSISTNGTLIGRDIARLLRDIKRGQIGISLDGDEDSNDKIRGGGSFKKALAGIEKLLENGIVPGIMFTPLKTNIHSLVGLVDILYGIGIRDLSFNSMHPTGRCRKIFRDIMLDPFEDITALQKNIDMVKSRYDDFYLPNANTFYRDLPTLDSMQKGPGRVGLKNNLKPCSAAHSSCNVTSSGWVIPCSEMFDFKGGNIREQDFIEIWRYSKALEEIRQLSSLSTADIAHCMNCRYNNRCYGGCRADGLAIYGDLKAPDPFCPYWREK